MSDSPAAPNVATAAAPPDLHSVRHSTAPDPHPSAAATRCAGHFPAVLIAALAAAIYLPTLGHGFVNVDDPQYVADNPYVLHPSLPKLRAAFTEVLEPTTVSGYYQPLTIASLMIDRLVEGTAGRPDAFVYHVHNVLLHALNSALAFAWLRRLTRGRGAGRLDVLAPFLAALVFAWHPVQVETVSWICQRKALLSTAFVLAALLAYDAFVRRRRIATLAAVTGLFVLSMLAKPTGWLLPAALLVLDYWPYRRLTRAALLEKVPIALLAVLGGWIAFESQRRSAARVDAVFADRPTQALLVAAHNVGFYPYKLLWPASLSPKYPLPPRENVRLANPPFLAGATAAVVLIAGLAACAARGRRGPPAALGGYFLLLGPALGAIGFMGEIAGDRFQYLPLVALLPGVAIGLQELLRPGGAWLIAVTGIAASVLALLGARTLAQQSAWRDSFAYWECVDRHAPNRGETQLGLGHAWIEQLAAEFGADPPPADDPRLERARQCFAEAVRRRPADATAYYWLGETLLDQGQAREAIACAERGLAQPGADAQGNFTLGRAWARLGRFDLAAVAYQKCLAERPRRREAIRNLANALCALGRWDEAGLRYRELIDLDPGDCEALYGLGRTQLTLTGEAAAIPPWEQARDCRPGDAQVRLALAACYAAVGREREAQAELTAALRLNAGLLQIAEKQPRFERLRGTPWWEQLRSGFGATTAGATTASATTASEAAANAPASSRPAESDSATSDSAGGIPGSSR